MGLPSWQLALRPGPVYLHGNAPYLEVTSKGQQAENELIIFWVRACLLHTYVHQRTVILSLFATANS